MFIVAIFILMWAVTDHVPAHRVFTEFQDGGGWGSIGLSTLVGIGSPLWFFVSLVEDILLEALAEANDQLDRSVQTQAPI
jgi:choline transport protein